MKKKKNISLYFLIMGGFVAFIVATILIWMIALGCMWVAREKVNERYTREHPEWAVDFFKEDKEEDNTEAEEYDESELVLDEVSRIDNQYYADMDKAMYNIIVITFFAGIASMFVIGFIMRGRVRAYIDDELLKQKEAEEKVREDRQRMVADISHDLKTPVTVITGYAQAIKDGMVDEEKSKEYVDAIYRKSIQVSELLNSFNEFAKLEHPDFEPEKTEDDLAEFLRGYLAEKYEEIEFSGFELSVSLPEDKVLFSYDPLLMKRAFDNIIGNSIKHNQPGTTISVSMTSLNEKIKIEISDDGDGIPESIRDTLFDPFSVGSESRKSGKGSGLGLSVTKRIIEAHGGTIELLDGGSSGTAYLITLS